MGVVLAEKLEEVHLDLAARAEVGVPAFGGRHEMVRAVPDEQRLPQPGASGDDRDIPRPGPPRLQRVQRLGPEPEHAVRRRLQIVEEPDARRGNREEQRRLVELPRQVGRDDASIDHGPGDAEARGGDRSRGTITEERLQHVFEPGVLPARQGRLAHRHERPRAAIEEGEDRLRPTDVAGEDHRGVTS